MLEGLTTSVEPVLPFCSISDVIPGGRWQTSSQSDSPFSPLTFGLFSTPTAKTEHQMALTCPSTRPLQALCTIFLMTFNLCILIHVNCIISCCVTFYVRRSASTSLAGWSERVPPKYSSLIHCLTSQLGEVKSSYTSPSILWESLVALNFEYHTYKQLQ